MVWVQKDPWEYLGKCKSCCVGQGWMRNGEQHRLGKVCGVAQEVHMGMVKELKMQAGEGTWGRGGKRCSEGMHGMSKSEKIHERQHGLGKVHW